MTGRIGILLLLLLPGLAPAASGRQVPDVRASSDRYTVEALDTGGGERPARVLISNNATSRRHMVSINSTLGALRRAVIREDQTRVAFLCEKGFAVVDPAGQVPAEEVYATGAVASPGARWIAYQRFYPDGHPGPSDGIVLYDTGQAQEKNHAAYPIAAEREWRAGWPVFPPAAEWKDANSVTPRSEAYTLSSTLAWEGTPAQPALIFTMRRGDDDTVVLAVPGGAAPRVCWARLPGSADRWRVKSLHLARQASGGYNVRAKSAAADRAGSEEASMSFPSDCTGSHP